MLTIEIPLRLPSLNEYIDACRANRYKAAAMKRDTEDALTYFLKVLPKFDNPVFVLFCWVEPNKKRDPDNIAFGKKFVFDALVKSGRLKNDNWQCVAGFEDTFRIGREPKIILKIKEMTQDDESNTEQKDN